MKRKAIPPNRIARVCECGGHGFISFQTWHVTVFDADRVPEISRLYWGIQHPHRRHSYVGHRSSGLILHRLLSGAGPGFVVDYINGDTMGNRSCNLRVCSHAENMRNRRKHRLGKSDFKGVYQVGKGWGAEVAANGKRIRKSGFKTQIEAARFYDAAAVLLHGEFARTNENAVAVMPEPARQIVRAA